MDNRNSQNLIFYKYKEGRIVKLPLYNNIVKAGFPSPADDFIEKHLDLNKFLIEHPAETYLVRVSGDSMKNAEISSGDILIVDRSLELYENCIAIFSIDGDFTVKKISKIKDKTYLIPENPKFKPIKIDENNELALWGIVTYIIHKC